MEENEHRKVPEWFQHSREMVFGEEKSGFEKVVIRTLILSQKRVENAQEGERVYGEVNQAYAHSIWPASKLMCEYIVRKKQIVEGKHVLELGSGTGVVGIVSSRLASSVWLTDLGEEEVLENLRFNASVNACNNTRVLPLEWGRITPEWISMAVPEGERLVLASDCFFESFVFESLCFTLHFLLHKKGYERAITSFQVRTEKSASELLERWGLSGEIIPPSSFLSQEEISLLPAQIELISITKSPI